MDFAAFVSGSSFPLDNERNPNTSKTAPSTITNAASSIKNEETNNNPPKTRKDFPLSCITRKIARAKANTGIRMNNVSSEIPML